MNYSSSVDWIDLLMNMTSDALLRRSNFFKLSGFCT
jgi:hypothetical protein